MVGLSIVLENQKHGGFNKKSPQVINKATMIINKPSFSSSSSSSDAANSHSTFPVPTFLQQCFLCKQTNLKKENCSFAAMKPRSTSSAASTSASRHRKGTRNGADGFVY
ncbi:FLZ-type domain-containing protein [Citrus sinensis]|uniref:FLZ-type domain-containing protein n=1 Tax=Citrus sinensis TaxID=2711 RepID=A0ACB8JPE4_CITSI|nr:FLZ-type domain-containing protein [Citrus sinensis]